jgi:large subunit ribosomal protein L21
MYAVIRAGGKQFRVAPGDVIKVDEKAAGRETLEFTDVLAVSAEEGKIDRPENGGATVKGTVVEEGRGDKILVFHFKRKKQYKKLQGHRQGYTAVRIDEISFGGQKYTAEKK